MWALVENNIVTKVFKRPMEVTTSDYVAPTYYEETILWTEDDELPEGMAIGSVKHFIGDIKTEQIGSIYSKDIFTSWTTEQLEEVGIYEIVIDDTNYRNEEYYINGAESFTFADGVVTRSFGVATPIELNDTVNEYGDTKLGLKSLHKANINSQTNAILTSTDWYIIREAEGGTACPNNILSWRLSVRTKSNEMCELVDAVTTVDELAALWERTNTGTEETPVYTRPLGEWPTLEE